MSQSQREPPTESPSSPTLSTPTQFQKLRFLFYLMAALLSLLLLSLILFFAVSGHRSPTTANITAPQIIHEVCKASRDPPTCQSSLSQSNHVPSNPTVLQALESASWVSSEHLNTGRKMVEDILEASAGNQNRSDTAKICLEILHNAAYRMKAVGEALPRGEIKEARAWTSAVLAYQYGCWSGMKNVNDTPLVGSTLSFFNSSLIPSTGDALAMMANYDFFGDETGSWGPPKTERAGFWEPGAENSGSKVVGGVPPGMKGDVSVCGHGHGCDYGRVQEAVDGAPDNLGSDKRFVIWIKAGVYEETVRVPLEKRNVVFMGDGMGKTVITGALHVGQPRLSTYNSATVGVVGDGFMATGLTIQNTAGPDAHQAVAFRSDSDRSVLQDCEFIGHQDTLYAHSLRQYYKSCRIHGNVDFIFGQSAAFFQDCLVLVVPRQTDPEKGENNAVTAHGRIDPAQSTGFVFQDCVINGSDSYMALYHSNPSVHKNYLGRPWKEYSRTVFIRCRMEDLIAGDGWMPWSGDFALETLYYGEFNNTGPGSNTSRRVSWSSQIPGEHVDAYSLQNFIQGDRWIPAILS